MKKKSWALLGISITACMISLDFTIVNASLTSIQQSLKISNQQLPWLITGFGLSFCALKVVLGRIGDLFGQRKLLYGAMLGFVMTSLAAGLALTPGFLISMRVMQGLFAAAIIPCGAGLIVAAFPKATQGRALGVYSSLAGIGLGFGPVLGGLIDAFLSWRWIFLINVPILLLSFIICLPVLGENKQLNHLSRRKLSTNGTLSASTNQSLETRAGVVRNKMNIDWLGALLLMIMLSAILLLVSQVALIMWPLANAGLLISIAIAAGLCLIKIEKRALVPILPLTLVKDRNFVAALSVYVVSAAFATSVLFLMSNYLTTRFHYSVEYRAFILAAMTVMTIWLPALAGYFYDKKSKRLVIHSVFSLAGVGLLLLGLLNRQSSLSLVLGALVIFGGAWGLGNGIALPLLISQQQAAHDVGLLSGTLLTSMNMIAILLLSLAAMLPAAIAYHGMLVASLLLWLLTVLSLRHHS